MRCTRGTLSECSGDVSNGTAVEACAAYPLSGQFSSDFPIIEGTISTVATNVDAVADLTCNPANTTDPYAAPGKCSGTSVVATATLSSGVAATSTSAALVREKANSVMALLAVVGGVIAML